MNPELESAIEQHLLSRRTWVSSDEICKKFEVRDRALRQVHGQQGLCSTFAISGNKGFKHVSLASTTEWLRFKHRLRKHGISELVRVSKLGKTRSIAQTVYRKTPYEKDTGQALLALQKKE